VRNVFIAGPAHENATDAVEQVLEGTDVGIELGKHQMVG
jgi:hypothetical protein